MSDKDIPGPEQIAAQLRKPHGELGTAVGNSMNKSNELLYDLVIAAMQLNAGENILELGFGNGKLFDKLFKVEDKLHIAGLDYSADMLKEAGQNNRGYIEKKMLVLKQGNSDNIPFAGNSFDKVFGCNVIYFWDDPAAHLKEVYRVLKPGGVFYAGFRSRSSMAAFPFTQFGFTLYEEADWKKIIESHQFMHAGTTAAIEILEMNDTKFELKNYCLAAQK